MFSQLLKTAARTSKIAPALFRVPMQASVSRRFYYPGNQLMPREEGDYFADPIAIAERVVRLIALHDNVRDPASVMLKSSFEDDLGLNVLDMQEIFLQAEREFDMEISEEDCESFVTVNDLVEHLARNFYTK